MNDQRSVLIVDQSEENCEVLRTVLERHGVRTLTASRTKEGADLAKQYRPDVIVLDTEFDAPDLGVFCGENGVDRKDGESQVIFLGKVRRNTPGNPVSRGDFFTKPYQYGPLIRRIEEILDNIPRKVA